MRDCAFCGIIASRQEEFANELLFPEVISFPPLNPIVDGHRLFIPVQHVSDAGESPGITGLVMEFASRFAEEFYDSYNLITSAGTAATQSVFHLHIHVVPRYPDDGLHLPWTGQVKV